VSDLLRSYLTIGVFSALAVALVAVIMGLGKLVRPVRPQAEKYVNYESGVDPAGSMWGQTQVRYYLFAVLFVLFDVEAVFVFPFATRAEAYGWFGFVCWVRCSAPLVRKATWQPANFCNSDP
jgi:NADH-quinone oxidoreductase subunit A